MVKEKIQKELTKAELEVMQIIWEKKNRDELKQTYPRIALCI